jgi:hypothetical protein
MTLGWPGRARALQGQELDEGLDDGLGAAPPEAGLITISRAS